MDKCVSVIIPCYNAEKTIERAIKSIYTQDYSAIELIVVDDGSTDDSKIRILEWQDRFKKNKYDFIYVNQENMGSGNATNTGLKYVTGDYISLLDADDEYLQGSITERVAFLESHPECDVVRSNGWIIKGSNKRPFVYSQTEKEREDIFVALLRGETNNWSGSYMVRSDSMFRFYPDREIYTSRYGQNLQFLLPLTYSKPCGFIDKPLMNYIQQDDSLSQTSDINLAKKRSLENAVGYRDIRIHMLKMIVTDYDEQQKYLKLIEGAYWRSILKLAAYFKDRKILHEAFEKLKENETPTFQDKVTYYEIVFPPISYFIRLINKLHRIIVLTNNKK